MNQQEKRHTDFSAQRSKDSINSPTPAESSHKPRMRDIAMDKRELSEEQIGIPVQTAKDAEDIFIPPESCHKLKMQYVALDTSELSEEQIGVPVQTAGDAELAPPVIGPAYNASDNKTIEEIAENPSTARRFLLSPILSACLALCGSVFFLIVFSEVAQFVSSIQNSPRILRNSAYFIIVILVLFMIWSMIRLIRTYRKLCGSPQVRIEMIREYQNRSVLRYQINKEISAGTKALKSIVASYPIKDPEYIKMLKKYGVQDDEITRLKKNVNFLKDTEKGNYQWIESCDKLFVSSIDAIAKRRVIFYSERVFLKTAICHNRLLDVFIVGSNSILMIEELCRIYNLRTNRWNTIRIAGALVYRLLIAANLEDNLDNLSDEDIKAFLTTVGSVALPGIAANFMAQAAPVAATAGIVAAAIAVPGAGVVAPAVAAAALSKATKRAAEGGINYLLFRRLGVATILSLRPIRSK